MMPPQVTCLKCGGNPMYLLGPVAQSISWQGQVVAYVAWECGVCLSRITTAETQP